MCAEITVSYIQDIDQKQSVFHTDLIPEHAGNGVANFVTLSKSGFYNGLKVFALVPFGWFQSGCPFDVGTGNAGLFFDSEAEAQKDKPKASHEIGALALVHSEKFGKCSSQFFMTLASLPSFNGKYTVIGKVDEKEQIMLKDFNKFEVDEKTNEPKKSITIKSIQIVTK